MLANGMYNGITNTVVLSPRALHLFIRCFPGKIKINTVHSKGYPLTTYHLGDIKLESSIWCREDLAYYFDKNSKVHGFTVDFDRKSVKLGLSQ